MKLSLQAFSSGRGLQRYSQLHRLVAVPAHSVWQSKSKPQQTSCNFLLKSYQHSFRLKRYISGSCSTGSEFTSDRPRIQSVLVRLFIRKPAITGLFGQLGAVEPAEVFWVSDQELPGCLCLEVFLAHPTRRRLGEDPQYTGLIMYFIWPGNALGSSRRCWKTFWGGKGRLEYPA